MVHMFPHVGRPSSVREQAAVPCLVECGIAQLGPPMVDCLSPQRPQLLKSRLRSVHFFALFGQRIATFTVRDLSAHSLAFPEHQSGPSGQRTLRDIVVGGRPAPIWLPALRTTAPILQRKRTIGGLITKPKVRLKLLLILVLPQRITWSHLLFDQ